MVDTQTALKRLQRELHDALRDESEKSLELVRRQTDYAHELAIFEKKHAWQIDNIAKANANKAESSARVTALRQQVESILADGFIAQSLPEGFGQERRTVVKYDPQGFLRIARDSFPFLLMLDVVATEKFFKAMAVEEADGAFIIPENIRRWADVEVIAEPTPVIDDEILIDLWLDDEPEVAVIKPVIEAWKAPDNFAAILTAPDETYPNGRELVGLDDAGGLPSIEDYSSQGESLPMSKPFNDDKTWKNKPIWDEAEPEPELVGVYETVPPTDTINF